MQALPERAALSIEFPRVEGYQQGIRPEIEVDWESLTPVEVDASTIPENVRAAADAPGNLGCETLLGPRRLAGRALERWRRERSLEEREAELAEALHARLAEGIAEAPPDVVFQQLLTILQRFLREKVVVDREEKRIDLFLAPYRGWVIERLAQAIRLHAGEEHRELPRYGPGRGRGSTAEVDFWTSQAVKDVVKSHVDRVVAESEQREQIARWIDGHAGVAAFVENQGLGFAIPCLHADPTGAYAPDFLLRLDSGLHVVLETRASELEPARAAAAERWVEAVNADGSLGEWRYLTAPDPAALSELLDALAQGAEAASAGAAPTGQADAEAPEPEPYRGTRAEPPAPAPPPPPPTAAEPPRAAEAPTRAERAEADRLPAAPRYVQAQLLEQPQGAREPVRVHALRAGALHELVVRVGPHDTGWDENREPLDESQLPAAKEHRLDVVLAAPALLDEPLSARIALPRRGASTTCSFRLPAPAAEGPLDGRIIVLHEGRIVQTALLRGRISRAPESVAAGEGFRLEPEAQVASFAALEGRSRFGGALIVNHDRNRVERLTVVAGEHVDLREPRGFEDAVAAIRARLEDAVTAEVDASSLRDEGTRDLLVYLARHGRTLHDALLDLRGGARLAQAERLQILAADAEAFFPLEFVYDRVSPSDDAALCPNAEAALAAGSCDRCAPAGDAATVCPLGFWCMSKVIERHVHDPEAAAAVEEDFRVDTGLEGERRQLGTLSAALFAASSHVDEYRSGSIDGLLQELGAVLGKPPARARSWSDWESDISSESPSLLVLLPHTQKDTSQLSTLVIEAGEQLAVDRIGKQDVGTSVPIVLLLGCRTGDPTIAFEQFPAAFRRGGAGIVLATLTRVLGRYACPIAARLVALLVESSRERQVTFGEVMRDVRRRLLAEGVATVLAVTAYGDADYVLGPKGG